MTGTADQSIDEWALAKARQIVFTLVAGRDITVYLYGSRASGKARSFSDIDIALDAGGDAIDDGLLAEIREQLEESNIPYTVDVVDLARTSQTFRDKIRREGIRWSD